ncbi:MAG: hypothetical protein MJZ00_01110 [Paludibacteraceae bacterium]|nr:hypothetical protein [Paludibacteraceae bacterium]
MKQKIYNLLMVAHRGLLENCYKQVFFSDSEIPAIKTFDDYLSDFYLYLYEAKPKRIEDDVQGYYLQQVQDGKAMPGWLRTTFRRFLLEENMIMREMQESLAEYRQELATSINSRPIDLTLMHVGFAIAWFNQHETSDDKYLFFRSAYKHFKGFYSWPDDDLDDKEVAMLLGIQPGALRTRTSRLCAKVKNLVDKLSDADIASLNRQSLDIVKEIYETPNPDIEAILERLLGDAERELPQYEQFVELRKEKRKSKTPFEKVKEAVFGSLVRECVSKEMDDHVQYNEILHEECQCECSELCEVDSPNYEMQKAQISKPTNKVVKIFQNLIDYDI